MGSAMKSDTQYYQVQVGAKLERAWMEYLPIVKEPVHQPPQGGAGSSFVLGVVDQAELMGIINSLHGWGLCLLSVKRMSGLTSGS
jgi:hypothetical protein